MERPADRVERHPQTTVDAVVSLVGRVLFGGFFLYNGLNHFMNLEGMAGYAMSKGLPMASFMVAASGLLLLLGGLSILLGFLTRIGAWLLVLFLVPTAFLMHNYWAVADAQAAAGEQVQFMKNMALAGAALMIAIVPRWPLSLDARTKR